MAQNIVNFHMEYMDVTQHWSDKSEKYAGADSLVTLLHRGWKMNSRVKREERWFAGMRSVYVYHIELEKDGQRIVMPVIHNPYMSRMIATQNIEIVPMEKQAQH